MGKQNYHEYQSCPEPIICDIHHSFSYKIKYESKFIKIMNNNDKVVIFHIQFQNNINHNIYIIRLKQENYLKYYIIDNNILYKIKYKDIIKIFNNINIKYVFKIVDAVLIYELCNEYNIFT